MQQYLGWVEAQNIRWQEMRTRYFGPVLRFLVKYKITPSIVSNFRLILGVIAMLVYLYFYRYMWAVNLLFLANILDVIDGALVRYQITAGDRSKFLDVLVDYILYAFVLILASVIASNVRAVGYNLFIVPLLYLLATIKKQEFLPSDWIIKSSPRVTYVKALVFIAFFAHWYFDMDLVWLDRALNVSNIWATILCAYYLLYIQLRWKKIKPINYSVKILFYNIQYGIGINKGGWRYVVSAWRHFLSLRSGLLKLEKFIRRVDADILAFDEIDGGSLRTLFNSQVLHLSSDIYHSYFFNCKYSNFFKHLPIFRKQGNAIFSKKKLDYVAHRLPGGVKDLIIEAQINRRVSIFLVHLSLGKKARHHQLKQFSHILKYIHKEKIILGDFNADMDDRDLKKFVADNKLTSANLKNAKTFPAWNPKREIDHFFVSRRVRVNSFQVLDNIMSDHLPVLLDCTLHNEKF
ncbi:MAG: endonuclease/exonuclease/phosphatase family protein [Candidatus Magasanikbacteria bacterium]|nr:endonuclease/exonuclease/phosphatase family protein [Candidatus Magasanikbacteria bacterium]